MSKLISEYGDLSLFPRWGNSCKDEKLGDWEALFGALLNGSTFWV